MTDSMTTEFTAAVRARALAVDLMSSRDDLDIYKQARDQFDRAFITCVLEVHQGNQSMAARVLGLSRITVRKRCKELGIKVKRTWSPSAGFR
jgi:DNA-binding protein Fis